MNKICIQFLLKIIRIFYNGSLNRFEIFKEVNLLINSIKMTNSKDKQDTIGDVFPSVKKKQSKENNLNNNEQEELMNYLDNESTNLSRKESIKKENEELNNELSRRKSSQLDTNLLEKVFEGDLGKIILSSLNSIQLITNLIDLLINFNSKQKIGNEDADILENSFELFCALLGFSEQGQEIESLILKEKKEDFSKLCLHGLLNKSLSIREKYCYSLIKLAKILTHYKKFDLVSFLFYDLFKFINSIENYDPNKFHLQQGNSNSLNNKNSNDNSNLNVTELFEFFSNLFEIYLSNKELFENLVQDKSLSPNEFLHNLSKTISDDINNLNNVNLKNEIFLGYLKILSKVVENITDMKEKISTNFNLIQDIMTKILFKQSNKALNEKLDKLKFINPDKFNDHKDNRNTNQKIRNSCFNFILSMLNNSIKNFEKFFQVNILEDEKEKEEKENNENNNNNNNNNNQMARYNFYNFNSRKVEDHVGLKNLGCICYMNSMLQQFFMSPTFRRGILQVDDGIEPDMNNNLNVDDNPFHQIQRMFSYLEMSNREDYNPEGFCFSFKDWDGNPTNTSIQQDAQEFLSRFLDKIEFALKPTDYKYLMHSVFGGKSCSQLVCEDGCGTSKNRYEDMFFLSLEVSNMKTIYDSLDKYISPEKIDDFNCDTCKKKVTITKRNVLSDLPNTLIVHLQRIFYNYEIDRNEKINSRLEFPKVLNLKNYTIEEMARKNAAKHGNANLNENNEGTKDSLFETEEIYFRNDDYYEYHLVGVNIHIGSADAGHYFSYINTVRNGNESEMTYDPKNENHTQSWLKFNDSRISKFA
jgi:ubiquitin carboxyl-terminal hydrolase 34